MERWIIRIHSTVDGKWQHVDHEEFGVFRVKSTAERKLSQLIKLGEIEANGIGSGSVETTDEKLAYTTRADYEWPMADKAFSAMLRDLQ